MTEISLCMIVKNEEAVIGRCLESVKDIADEIIIVDTGSTDSTKEIISKYTDKIYDFKWVDDFAKARNFSFSKATKEYIMWLDADDVILPEDYEKFIKLKQDIDTNIDIYVMKYNYFVDKDNIPSLIQDRARLFKRSKNYQWISPIHEVIIRTGNVKDIDISITHKKEEIQDPYRNIRIFEKMKAEGIQLDDRQEYCYAREFYGMQEFKKARDLYEEYIQKYEVEYQDKKSFLYPAFLELSDCYKNLFEKEKQLSTLLKVLKYDIPGSDCCCKIGDVFLESKEYKIAIFWYELAICNKDIQDDKGDVNIDYKEYTPYINLGVCYYWMGDREKAKEFNEKAGRIKPNDDTYLYNKNCFQ
ncbi:MAG: glycosyltransferase [Clostridia bacterium]